MVIFKRYIAEKRKEIYRFAVLNERYKFTKKRQYGNFYYYYHYSWKTNQIINFMIRFIDMQIYY